MECDCVRNGPSTASKIEARTTILPLEAQDLPSLDELEDILYPNVRGYDDLGFEFTIRGYTYRVVEDRPKGFEVATAAHLGCFGGWIRTDMKSHLLGDKWFVARMIGAA